MTIQDKYKKDNHDELWFRTLVGVASWLLVLEIISFLKLVIANCLTPNCHVVQTNERNDKTDLQQKTDALITSGITSAILN
jgi:hypothetical protein